MAATIFASTEPCCVGRSKTDGAGGFLLGTDRPAPGQGNDLTFGKDTEISRGAPPSATTALAVLERSAAPQHAHALVIVDDLRTSPLLGGRKEVG